MKYRNTLGRTSLSFGIAAITAGAAPAQAQETLPFPSVPSATTAGRTLADSRHKWRAPQSQLAADAPNILVIMLDDAGFAQADTFGGAIHTPTLTRVANSGVRYNAFHTTAISSATRAALLTKGPARRSLTARRSAASRPAQKPTPIPLSRASTSGTWRWSNISVCS